MLGFLTTNPSYPVGNQSMLNGVDSNSIFYTSDGVNYAVDADGVVYRDSWLGWTRDDNFTVAVANIEQAAPGAVQQAASAGGFDFKSFLDNLSTIVGTVVQAKAQSDLLKTNLELAKQGKPPIQAQNYMPGVNVGVSGDTKNMIYILAAGGLLVAAIALMPKKRGR